MNPSRVASRYLRAGSVTLNQSDADKLRKDFLILMRNTDRVATFEDLASLYKATRIWVKFYRTLIEDLIRGGVTTFRWAINGEDKYVEHTDKEVRIQAEYWGEKVRSGMWPLSYAVAEMPFDTWKDYSHKWGHYRNEDDWRGEQLSNWEKTKKKWSDKAKREARKAWAVLDDYFNQVSMLSEGAATPVKDTKEVYQQDIEGFNVTLVRMDRRDISYIRNGLEKFKVGLAHYRDRASKVFPLLLGSAKLPIVFDGDGDIDCGGSYEGGHIVVCPVSSPPKEYAHFIAHEMGHHIYRTYLSEADHDFWSTAVGQDYAEADLNDLLAEWREGEWSLDVVKRLSQTNPVMALQISGLAIYGHLGDTRDDAVKYLAKHGPKVRVPLHPISGYSTKNSEEAFCEAVGRLVAYGPRAVEPVVLGWLKTILPRELKVASVLRVASRYFATV